MSHKLLYFLTYEGNPGIFSGYGIPLKDGEKSPLVGMLMVDGPNGCPEEYLQGISRRSREEVGEVRSEGTWYLCREWVKHIHAETSPAGCSWRPAPRVWPREKKT